MLKKIIAAVLLCGYSSAIYASQKASWYNGRNRVDYRREQRRVARKQTAASKQAREQVLAQVQQHEKSAGLWGQWGVGGFMVTTAVAHYPCESREADVAAVTALCGTVYCFVRSWIGLCRSSRLRRKLDESNKNK